MGKLGTIVNAALGQIENPDLNNVTLKVKNVCELSTFVLLHTNFSYYFFYKLSYYLVCVKCE